MFTYTDIVRERIEAPLDAVWPILADFGGRGRYVPSAQVERVEGEGVGCVRVIPGPRGEVRERLEAFDAAGHAYSYRVLDGSPVNMRGYVSDLKVVAEGDGACRVDWGGRFETASAKDAVTQKKGLEQFYRNAIAAVAKLAVN